MDSTRTHRLLTAGLPRLPRGVHAAIVFEPYAISGASAEALARAMYAEGPRGSEDDTVPRPFQGYTTWHVGWRYKAEPESAADAQKTDARGAASCFVREAKVELEVKMTLPQWKAPPDAPLRLIRKWERYKKALVQHENGHRDHGFLAARDTYRALKQLRSATCADLQEEAKRVAARISERYVEAGRRYDRQTQHGRTEGVIWPPREARR